jgi:hypothetical protein
MKKLFYISILVLLSIGAYSIVPNPVDTFYSSYIGDGYPEELKISAPAPNPVIDYAEIWYNIPEGKSAEISIYNFAGVQVKSFPVSGGLNKINFEAYDLQSGVYFVCLIYEGKNVDSKKMVKK